MHNKNEFNQLCKYLIHSLNSSRNRKRMNIFGKFIYLLKEVHIYFPSVDILQGTQRYAK